MTREETTVSDQQITVCDQCGKPATHMVRDVVRTENWKTGHIDCEPLGSVRHGCDDHPVQSETHWSNGMYSAGRGQEDIP